MVGKELIYGVPEYMFYTRHNDIDYFLNKPGGEGQLCESYADNRNEYGRDSDLIVNQLNNAYLCCTEIMLMQHPEYHYDLGKYIGMFPLKPQPLTYVEFCLILTLLNCQPEEKKTKALKKFCNKLDNIIYNSSCYDNEMDVRMLLDNARMTSIRVDIDFTPKPDMAVLAKELKAGSLKFMELTDNFNHDKVKFLIGLMRTKEDKLLLLDVIDQEYDNIMSLPF